MEKTDYWRHERIAFLALSTLKGVGFRTLYKIAESELSFNAVLRNPEKVGLERLFHESELQDAGGQQRLWVSGLAEARLLASFNVTLLFKGEPNFPQKLAAIPDCPHWLFVQGSIDNLYMPAMSIVGTRKPSSDGIFLTKFLVAALAHQKCVTVSGLALGIDQTAHSESNRYGVPTVAVLGTGILDNYPKGSETLRAEILNNGGTVISEYLPRQSYSAENFVRRNRLQAALADILFPTEWQIKSGTAHTVKFANKYGKKIINLHLPGSFAAKPELAFAEEAYKAISLEVPKDTQLLFGLITYFTESDHVQLTSPPDHIATPSTEQSSTDLPAALDDQSDQPKIVEEAKDPQLSLL